MAWLNCEDTVCWDFIDISITHLDQESNIFTFNFILTLFWT